jgi:hypothetical protein
MIENGYEHPFCRKSCVPKATCAVQGCSDPATSSGFCDVAHRVYVYFVIKRSVADCFPDIFSSSDFLPHRYRHGSLQNSPVNPFTDPRRIRSAAQGYRTLDSSPSQTSTNLSPGSPRHRILFYHKHDPHYGFTNFSAHPVVFQGKTYPTSEHLFQSFKVIFSLPDFTPYI